MDLVGIITNIGEVAICLLFFVGAVFNISWTLRHGEEFYGSFATSAWFSPSRKLARSVVIPNAKLFTVMMIALQLTVAVTILSRGSLVELGLIMGAVFSFAVVPVSNIPGAMGNFALGVALAILALAR